MLSFVVLYAGIALYVIVFCEAFTRVFAPQPIVPRYVTGGPNGIRVNIADSTYRQQTQEVDVEIRINSQGFRSDKDFLTKATNGVCRVAIFGDSFFMGYEVDLGDSFAYFLESELRKASVNAEVINFSVSGFGTAESIRALEENGVRYMPNIVLFEWHRSDLNDNIRSDLYGIVNGELVERSPTYLPAVGVRDFLMDFYAYRWLINNSHFYSAARERAADFAKRLIVAISKLSRADSIDRGSTAPREPGQSDDYESRLAAALINKAYRATTTDSSRFALVSIPTPVGRSEFVSSLGKITGLLAPGLVVVDPLSSYHGYASKSASKVYFEKGHGHLTPAGNRLLAIETVKSLLSDGLLAVCR